ncbi:MAG: TPM domain-containing protein [Gammaproteobacteria bacterium]|nr:TPM domain-containing protein [Gammaproteobacteria bacterium]
MKPPRKRDRWRRLLRHLFIGHHAAQRAFPPPVRARIAAAVGDGERCHAGDIRVAIEAALHPAAVLRGMTPRQRALEVFAQLRVWDTEHNDGVLIYLLIADRAVEIVADRGAARAVTADGWQQICAEVERHFRAGRFEAGVLSGVQAVAAHLAPRAPGAADANELPDAPVLLS